MAKPCKCDPHELCEECPEWIFTLADLIMCMMGLFVILWVLKPGQNQKAGEPGSEELTIDHVVPRAQGGISSWDNCVLACIVCNKRKADRTPHQASMRLRSKPVRPAWRPIYASSNVRIASWSKFVSEAYWNVTLKE